MNRYGTYVLTDDDLRAARTYSAAVVATILAELELANHNTTITSKLDGETL